MSYDKYTWTTGETITADELNRMEAGISSAQGGGDTPLLALHYNSDSGVYEAMLKGTTYAELKNKLENAEATNLRILEFASDSQESPYTLHYISVQNNFIAGEFYRHHPASGSSAASDEVMYFEINSANEVTVTAR